jgi:hypothetical protein
MRKTTLLLAATALGWLALAPVAARASGTLSRLPVAREKRAARPAVGASSGRASAKPPLAGATRQPAPANPAPVVKDRSAPGKAGNTPGPVAPLLTPRPTAQAPLGIVRDRGVATRVVGGAPVSGAKSSTASVSGTSIKRRN